MSRWLWALLGGVVLVAIAAVYWTASNQTNVAPPVSPAPATVTSAPVPPAPPAPVAQEPAPSSAPAPPAQQAAPSPPPPASQEAAAPPAPAPAAPSASAPTAPPTTPEPSAGQQVASTPAPAPLAETPSAPSVVAQEPPPPPAPAPLAEAPVPPTAPGREQPEVQGEYAPKNLAQLVGAWAYSPEDCGRLFERRGGSWAYRQPVDKFAQAAIVESPKRILLPSSTCRVERASEGEGGLKVSAECADSISYSSRSTVIMLRSPTELLYSASGDPVLAITLKKCAS